MSIEIQSLRPTNFATWILRQLSITIPHLFVAGSIHVNFWKSFDNGNLDLCAMISIKGETVVALEHHLIHLKLDHIAVQRPGFAFTNYGANKTFQLADSTI